MEKPINYAYAYGHMSGALTGYRLVNEMKKKGLELNDWDLEVTIRHLLDDVIHDIKKEAKHEASKEYMAHGS